MALGVHLFHVASQCGISGKGPFAKVALEGPDVEVNLVNVFGELPVRPHALATVRAIVFGIHPVLPSHVRLQRGLPFEVHQANLTLVLFQLLVYPFHVAS